MRAAGKLVPEPESIDEQVCKPSKIQRVALYGLLQHAGTQRHALCETQTVCQLTGYALAFHVTVHAR